ncbi:MAG TPA: adenylate/guanylate cyclase domain-containing protein [Actinomycetota bacterium]|nr:adenylate/guanylate cyclase domain-containing protein [Actinomycetota bacterium]
MTNDEARRPTELPMPDRSELEPLLKEYNEHPEVRERVVADIDAKFRRDVAVLVLDACGFSRSVRAKGIVHFLALLERLERLIAPCVEEHHGRILRREADNLYAVFDTADHAVRAAIAIRHDVRAANEALPEDEEVGVSIGVGFGELLLIGPDDAWGEQMNLASKLGEDLADCDEILITAGARDALESTDDYELTERDFHVSGVTLPAFHVGR